MCCCLMVNIWEIYGNFSDDMETYSDVFFFFFLKWTPEIFKYNFV